MSSSSIPPDLLRRLRFRAKRHHRTIESELVHCLSLGLKTDEEPLRFLERARRLRQESRGVLTNDDLHEMINHGRP